MLNNSTSIQPILWIQEGCFALSIAIISYVATTLHRDATLKSQVALNLILAVALAALLNTQAAFVIIIIFATTFLLTCPPLALARFTFFIPLQLCINCAAITFVSLVTIRNSIGAFPFLLFLIFYVAYLLASSIYRLFLPNKLGYKILYIIGIYILLNLLLMLAFMYFLPLYATSPNLAKI